MFFGKEYYLLGFDKEENRAFLSKFINAKINSFLEFSNSMPNVTFEGEIASIKEISLPGPNITDEDIINIFEHET